MCTMHNVIHIGCVRSDVSDDHLTESAATLVHATSHVDQCNAGATKSVTDTLQRVVNTAARVVSDTRKFDHGLTRILHEHHTLAQCS